MKPAINATEALGRSFYSRSTIDVALDLLGKRLRHQTPRRDINGEIVEVEAYLGKGDPACHAYRSKTRRTAIFWQPPGTAYVYLVYGLHYCLNVITRHHGTVGCVLIRAVELLPESGAGPATNLGEDDRCLASGPGRVTRIFGINDADNGHDLTRGQLQILRGKKPGKVAVTRRIGISRAADEPLRFYVSGNACISHPGLPVIFTGPSESIKDAFTRGTLKVCLSQ